MLSNPLQCMPKDSDSVLSLCLMCNFSLFTGPLLTGYLHLPARIFHLLLNVIAVISSVLSYFHMDSLLVSPVLFMIFHNYLSKLMRHVTELLL